MSKFSQERRDALKSTCRLVTVTALASGAGVRAFAAGGAMPLAQSTGVPQVGDTFVFSGWPEQGQGGHGRRRGPRRAAADWRWRRIRARASWNKTTLESTITPPSFSTGWRRIAYPAGMKDDTVEGISCYSAVCPHLGCLALRLGRDGQTVQVSLPRCDFRSRERGTKHQRAAHARTSACSHQGSGWKAGGSRQAHRLYRCEERLRRPL